MNNMIIFENENPIISQEALEQLAVIDTNIKLYDKQYKDFKEKLKEAMEEAGVVKIEMPNCDVTYIGATTRETLDSKALRAEEPETYNKYVKASNVKSSIRIKVKSSIRIKGK